MIISLFERLEIVLRFGDKNTKKYPGAKIMIYIFFKYIHSRFVRTIEDKGNGSRSRRAREPV